MAERDIEFDLHEMHRRVHRARRLSQQTDDLFTEASRGFDEESIVDIIEELSRRDLADHEMEQMRSIVESIADQSDSFPSREKAYCDRRLKDILLILPEKIAFPIALDFLDHPRKARRDIAVTIFRKRPVDETTTPALMARYREAPDQLLLEFIARSPTATASINFNEVHQMITDSYWRMRLAESAITSSCCPLEEIARSYPFEFTHAVGRNNVLPGLPFVRELIHKLGDDPEFITLASWTLEKLRDWKTLSYLPEFNDDEED